jgi:hypothetical protein
LLKFQIFFAAFRRQGHTDVVALRIVHGAARYLEMCMQQALRQTCVSRMDQLSARPFLDYGGPDIPAVIRHCAEFGRFHSHYPEPIL